MKLEDKEQFSPRRHGAHGDSPTSTTKDTKYHQENWLKSASLFVLLRGLGGFSQVLLRVLRASVVNSVCYA